MVGWRTIGSADRGRARDPAAGAEAPRRAGFRFTRPSLRQSAFPSASNRPVRGGRAAGVPPHGARLTAVKRDFRARCRNGGACIAGGPSAWTMRSAPGTRHLIPRWIEAGERALRPQSLRGIRPTASGRQRPILRRAGAGERRCVSWTAKLETVAASGRQPPTLRRAGAGERHCVPGLL